MNFQSSSLLLSESVPEGERNRAAADALLTLSTSVFRVSLMLFSAPSNLWKGHQMSWERERERAGKVWNLERKWRFLGNFFPVITAFQISFFVVFKGASERSEEKSRHSFISRSLNKVRIEGKTEWKLQIRRKKVVKIFYFCCLLSLNLVKQVLNPSSSLQVATCFASMSV